MSLPRHIIYIIIATIFIGVFYAFYVNDRPRVDAAAYDNIAWNLARGFGYVEDVASRANPEQDDAIIRVGPGYQFFLAGIYSVFGHDWRVVWIIQNILRGLSILIVYLIARFLFPSEQLLATLATAFLALSPDLIVMSGLLLTETFFIFLLLLGTLGTIFFLQRGGLILIFTVGAVWALSILTRPSAILILLILLAFLLIKKMWKEALLLLLMPLILVGSWSYFATLRYGGFILTTTAGGYDLWVGNNEDAKGGFEKTPEIQEARRDHTSLELDRIGKEKYLKFLRDHPIKFFELQLRKTAQYFSLARPGGFWIGLWAYPERLLVIISSSFIWMAAMLWLGIAGIVTFIKEYRDSASRTVFAIALLQPLSVIPIIVETRYRYPLLPFLALFAAYFLTRKHANKSFLLLVLFLLLSFTGYDLWYNWESFMDKINLILS